MTKTIISSKVQQRLNNPLAQKDFIIKPNEKLRIRITAKSKNLTTSARALLCRILFFDATSQPIDENYHGAFFSPIYGNYLYIPSITGSEKGEWLKRTITAPKHAHTARLIVLEGESTVDHLETLKDIECISGNLPLLETELPVTPSLPNKLSLYFAKKIDTRNAALISIAYFDQNENEIQGPHLNLAFSTRYGYFKYIHRTNGANIFELCLLAPSSATSMRLRVYGLQNTIDIEFKRSPKLEVYSIYKKLSCSDNWQRVSPQETIRLTIPTTHISGEAYKLPLQYVANCENEKFEILSQTGNNQPSSDNTSPFNSRESSFLLSDTSNKSSAENLIIYLPANTTYVDLTFKLSQFDTVFLKKNIALNKITDNFNVVYRQPKSHFDDEVFFDIAPLWKPLLVVSIPNTERPTVTSAKVDSIVTFYDASYRPLLIDLALHKSIFGEIFQVDASTLKLSPEMGFSTTEIPESMTISVALLELPEKCRYLGIKILNSPDTTISNVQLKLSKFHTLMPERVTENSYEVILTDTELPSATTRSLLTCLTKKYPNAPAVLDQALQIYCRLGDIEEPAQLCIHILNDVKNAALRNKARLFLSELESMNPAWSPSINVSTTKQTKTRRANRIIARLLGTQILEQGLPSDFHIQNEVGETFFITPLGYASLGKTGYPWEKVICNNVSHYLLNCITQEDLATVPTTIQIEFSTLLSAQILQIEETTIIHATVLSNDYRTALIALTLSKALALPLVLEFMDNILFDAIQQQEPTEHTMNAHRQLCRCAKEADAIIITSTKNLHFLHEQGINFEKIFINPFMKLAKQSTREILPGKQGSSAKTYNDIYHYAQKKRGIG